MLSHSTAVLSGLHNSTSTGSSDACGSDACDATMHEEHTDLWQCEAAAARPGAGSMFAKAVAVRCIMYRAAVVQLYLLDVLFCVFTKKKAFLTRNQNASRSVLISVLETFRFMVGESLQGFVWEISQ